MKTRKEHKENTIKELTEAIKELRTAENKVENIINKLVDKHQEHIIKPEDDKLAIPRTTLRIGDRVKIVNAKEHQEDQGTITRYKVGEPFVWIWIKPKQGVQIKRIARNLRKIA